MPLRILFVSHDASRTGAPIVLLHLLRWFKKNSEAEIYILLKSGGELKGEFDSVSPAYVWNNNTKKKLWYRIRNKFYRVRNKINLEQHNILEDLKYKKLDLVYMNTIDSHDLIPTLKLYLSVPFISHVHENEYSSKALFAHQMTEELLKEITHFIAVSKCTLKNLVCNYNINQTRVSLFYPFISVESIRKPKRTLSEIKTELGIDNEFIIGACGTTGWRKGVDYFINLSFVIKNFAPEIKMKFIWVGQIDAYTFNTFKYEKDKLGIDNIIFTGSKTNPEDYFQIFDVFALTSREDPFPLVCLEVAAQSKPIICFENAGGMPEFVQKGGGWSVPYGDVLLMARKIIELAKDTSQIDIKGIRANELVKGYDADVIVPQIYDCIKTVVRKYSYKT